MMLEYDLISSYYGKKTASRSKVPLINHIDEGIKILKLIGSSSYAIRAFCLHPLIQSDEDLIKNQKMINGCEGYVVLLTMEYRRVANNYLSYRKIDSLEEIELSPIDDVNDMLIADKIQNQKDFYLYHYGRHPRSEELSIYFDNWIEKLRRYKTLR